MIILGYLNITRMHSPDCAWPRVSPLLMMPPTAHYTLQTPHWHWGIPVTPGDLEGRLGLTTTLTPSSTCHQSGFRTRNMIGAGSPLTHCHHGCDRLDSQHWQHLQWHVSKLLLLILVYWEMGGDLMPSWLELRTKVHENLQSHPSSAFSWLKAPSSTFTFI